MTVTTLGTFAGANDKDKSARIPAAIAALNKALAGDAASLLYMQQQAAGSATAVGKDAFRRALSIYATNSAPAPVAAAPVPHPSPTYSPPAPLPPAPPSVTSVPSEPHPVGFDYAHAPLIHPPVPVPGGVTVYGSVPGVILPVNIGSSYSPNGGAITGPPAPESSGPLGVVPAAADFGYVAPGSAPLEGAPATAPATSALDPKMILFLVAAAALFFFVDAHRPRGK